MSFKLDIDTNWIEMPIVMEILKNKVCAFFFFFFIFISYDLFITLFICFFPFIYSIFYDSNIHECVVLGGLGTH